MANFKQIGGKRFSAGRGDGFGKREGGRPNFGGKSWDGPNDRERGPVTMYRATCGQCGKACEVPFRPLSGKTVYCADCFRGKKEGEERGSSGYPQKRSSNYKSFSRPDFRGDRGGESGDDLKKQMEMLGVKMDRLTRAVEALVDANRLAIKERALGSEDIIPIIKDEK